MGICVTAEDVKKHRKKHGYTVSNDQLGWNMTQFQATSFVVDGANIKVNAEEKHMPHRICSVQPFLNNAKYTVKARYVNLTGNGAFSLGVFFYHKKSKQDKIQKVGIKYSTRLYVSKHEGEVQASGQIILNSKEWKTQQKDTIIMNLNTTAKTIQWKKQNTMEVQAHKMQLPTHFHERLLHLELIIYHPETELNIQVQEQN